MISYVINRKTLAVTALNEKQSLVYEVNRQIVIERSPLQIVRKSCHVFGSSFEGRIEGTRHLTGYRYKMPIVIQEYDELVMFPTKSPSLASNEWVCLNHIENFYPNYKNKNTIVKFDDGLVMEFGVSYPSFKNQYMKASYLAAIIKQNK